MRSHRSQLKAAVQGLDPASRALLDLSLRRRIPDQDIARLLGTSQRVIAQRRAAAVRELGVALSVQRPGEVTEMMSALATLPADAWGVPGTRAPITEAAARRPARLTGRGRRRLGRVMVLGVPISAVGAVAAMVLAAGGDEPAGERGHLPAGAGKALAGVVAPPPESGSNAAETAAGAPGTSVPESEARKPARRKPQRPTAPPAVAPAAAPAPPVAAPEPRPQPRPPAKPRVHGRPAPAPKPRAEEKPPEEPPAATPAPEQTPAPVIPQQQQQPTGVPARDPEPPPPPTPELDDDDGWRDDDGDCDDRDDGDDERDWDDGDD